MFAFIGALGLGVAFRDSFTELSTPKSGDYFILRRCDWFNSPRVHISNKNPFVLAATVVLVVAFSIALFKKQ